MGSTCCVMEIVTPLLALRRMLQLGGLRSSRVYGCLRVAIVCTFVPVRATLSVVMLGRIAFHYKDWLDLNVVVRCLGFGICGITITALNVYSALVLALSSCRVLVVCVADTKWTTCIDLRRRRAPPQSRSRK